MSGRSTVHSTPLFWGESMDVVYPEMVSVYIDRYGFFEEGLTAFALQRLKPGMTVCDIGGHFGYFSRLAEFLTRESGCVHTFEPTPSTFEVLDRNTRRFPSIHLNQLAVADQPGTLQLTDYGTTLAAFNTIADGNLNNAARQSNLAPKQITVSMTSIDAYVEERQLQLDFVKIDAEGAEPLIIKGMQKTLESARPLLSMEVGDSSDRQSAETVKILTDFGYTIQRYNSQNRSFEKVGLDREYSHDNLFFIHEQNA